MISRVSTCPDRAVIELKVVRGLTSAGMNVSAANESARILGGRTQVASYAKDFGAAIRLLCAYDLRRTKDPSIFDPINKVCVAESVTFKNYPILNSSAAARAASVQSA